MRQKFLSGGGIYKSQFCFQKLWFMIHSVFIEQVTNIMLFLYTKAVNTKNIVLFIIIYHRSFSKKSIYSIEVYYWK
jgi:hypothetical protein